VATDDATPEEWRSVPDWDGWYEASDRGRIRSLDRTVACCTSRNGQRRIPGRILRQWTNTAGYPAVTLNSGDARESWRVDLLVQETFDPPDTAAWAQERWRPVPGFEDWYDVSDLGRVRSWHPPFGARGRRKKPYLLTPTAKGTGKYLMVALRQGAAREDAYVHTLVLTAFDRPRKPGEEGRHGPAGRYVNAITNLCWGTIQENHQDRTRDDAVVWGERHGNAKLTAAAVLDCRKRFAAGEKLVNLAREYGVSNSGLSQAISGATWPHLR
jgi:hypothetical protein